VRVADAEFLGGFTPDLPPNESSRAALMLVRQEL